MDKIAATRQNCSTAPASSPRIISASRATDIPAFYMEWLMHRLQQGYLAWTNPFSRTKSYIDLRSCRFIVFWSKNPAPLLTHIDTLQSMGINCYLQFTLNDYEAEGLEANVPSLSARIDTFRRLSDRLGPDAVVWRFDPLILSPSLSTERLAERVARIGERLQGYTKRLIFSFADIDTYRRVHANLARCGFQHTEWTLPDMLSMGGQLSALNASLGWHLQLATCAERIDLSPFGIAHSSCIDGDLIVRLAAHDSLLMTHLGVEFFPPAQGRIMQQLAPTSVKPLPDGRFYRLAAQKDKGQRPLCRCIRAKDIGQYNTCPHACLYCYANADSSSATANWQKHRRNPLGESIV